VVADEVCWDKDNYETCVIDFCFFMIESETGFGDGDAGILGLGPPYAANGPSFFGTLIKQKGAHGYEPIASWVLESLPNASYVDFGSYDAFYVVGEMIAHKIVENAPWWELSLSGMMMGD